MSVSYKKRVKNSKEKITSKRYSFASLKRKAWEMELGTEHGKEWLKKNKAMLDAQWKYITTLGI